MDDQMRQLYRLLFRSTRQQNERAFRIVFWFLLAVAVIFLFFYLLVYGF